MSDEKTTRDEHLQWCKDRALRELEYYQRTEPDKAVNNAYASMCSDLNKHDETRDHPGIMLGLMLMMGGHMNAAKIRDYILGFN